MFNSAQGDSGGPLIYQDRISGRFQLHGITSWGDGCGEKGKPGVYTRVSAFSDWIQTEIQSESPERPTALRRSYNTGSVSNMTINVDFFLRVSWKSGANVCRASEDDRNDRGGAEGRVQLSLSLLHADVSTRSVHQLLQQNGRG